MMLANRKLTYIAFTAAFAATAIPGTCLPATAELVPAVDTETWPDAPFRWKDIATNLYSQSYKDTYTYDDAGVTVTFESLQDSVFTGHLSAFGLKPNFAYQMKMVGKPTGSWGGDGDDITNEIIGYAGRWWRVTPNPGNSNDQDYEAHRDDPEYIFEGYLLFGFFVADRFGSAEVDFTTGSSYHVLWWDGQRARGACDSPVRYSTVVGQAGDPAYDGDVGPLDVGVYAEIERLCYGETVLPGGAYDCRFFLTEESFHQSGEDEGYWLSVLVCDTLAFDLRGLAGAGAADQALDPGPMRVLPNPAGSAAVVEFRLSRDAPVDLVVYDTAGRLVTRLADGGLPAGDHSLCWDGTDCSGRRVPAGIYFCRLRAYDEVRTRKIVLTGY
jgi:hypothetical protein